jgi:hypothetical protein
LKLTRGQEVPEINEDMYLNNTCPSVRFALSHFAGKAEEDPEDEEDEEEEAPKKKLSLVLPNIPVPRFPKLMPEPAARPPPRRLKPLPLLALDALILGRQSAIASSCFYLQKRDAPNTSRSHVSFPDYKLSCCKVEVVTYFFSLLGSGTRRLPLHEF